MKKELDEKLVKKYPLIFKDRHGDMKTTAMCWGFDCDDGWYWLIDNLCESIQSYIDNNKHNNIEQIVATQVKEKYGGLRFYYIGGNEHIDGMVSFAEDLSYVICENCGSTENVTQTKKGWIYTRCEACHLKEEQLKKEQLEEQLEELKNDLHSQLFHQTNETAKIIVDDFYIEHPILREWVDINRENLIGN